MTTTRTASELRNRLRAEGWEERFSAAGTRLEEAAEHYRLLGYEVRIEGIVESAEDGACTSCFGVVGADGPVGVIFTRGGIAAAQPEEDLFD